jgi:tetratricopeptide (TPR) repeat protein
MNADKRKEKSAKRPANAPAAPVVPAVPVHVPPLFRAIDWFTFGITTLVIFTAYFLTLAPELTLEDSGELATGSFYAGVPHPPGYPTWTMYSWLFTVLLPFKNIAWRVAVSSAVAGALSCGLLAFLVSRGSSMMIEGIAGLKDIGRRWENAICVVSGFVAGCLIGFNGFMWSQSNIVEVYPFSVLSLMGVLLCLMRWIYAPHQRRYLYWAIFLYGVSFTNHQTLILACLGIEVAILAADYKVGRNLFACNGLVYFCGLVLKLKGVLVCFDGNTLLFSLYNVIGVGSLYVFLWYSLKGKRSTRAFVLLGHFFINAVVFVVWFKNAGKPGAAMSEGDFTQFMIFLNPVLVPLIYLFCLLTNTAETVIPFQGKALWREWSPPWIGLFCWISGAAFYLYMPITSMTNPPMNWGYARTYEGFWHAFSRGQYGTTNPSDVFGHPFRFLSQMLMALEGVVEEFNWVYVLIALVPFLFFLRMQKRERAWIIGITAIYISLTSLLTLLLNSSPDRQSQELNRVFYAASHLMVAMAVGYGLTLIAASMAVRYQAFRGVSILGGIAAADFAFFSLVIATKDLVSNSLDINSISLDGLGKIVCWFVIVVCAVLAKRDYFQPERLYFRFAIVISFLVSCGLTVAMLLNNTLQLDGLRDFVHTLVISFNRDQYALPIFAGLILLAMTLIFLAAVFLRRNRAPLALSLALFAAMPMHSALRHWFDNEQRGHWFGYWFGHDMFTPPFVGPDGKFGCYDPKLREQAMKGPNGHLVYPEMTRNTILFGGTDPGRFCPTYTIFCDSFIPDKCKPAFDQKYDRRDVYIITQNALADGTYLSYIRAQYFRSSQNELKIDTPFFREFATHMLGIVFGEDSSFVHGVASTVYHVLDVPLTKFGAKVEARRRAEGVFPPKEIYTPTPEDSQNCFRAYTEDVARRSEIGQLRPGEDVKVDSNGRVQVAGQVAVMMINGLLCKVIFEHNPTNEFFVEESFPLDWMYPYETPFGIIMKINRNPLPELPEEVFKRDHEFWSRFSERLIGNWVTYDTSVREIADFADKVYLRYNFSGFKGDRKFLRDNDAQKAFSKLRSSIAGVYAWRAAPGCPPEYRQKTAAQIQQLNRETDFAFKQAFAFCPFSPEAVFRYVNFLLQFNRLDDAIIVTETCLKLDPYNGQVGDLLKQLRGFKKQFTEHVQAENQLQHMEDEARKNPTNFQNLFMLAGFYLQMQQTNRAFELLDQALANPHIPSGEVASLAQLYAQLGNFARLEGVLKKLAALAPEQPEPRYDLAALYAVLGRNPEALQDLHAALDLSAKRLQHSPSARNLVSEARTDPRFNSLRLLPEFQKLVPPN